MKVNSYNEWSPLKEVIVGSPINYNVQDLELSFKLFFHDNAYFSFYYPTYGTGNSAEKGEVTTTETQKPAAQGAGAGRRQGASAGDSESGRQFQDAILGSDGDPGPQRARPGDHSGQ
jgi:hypothetical protein